MPRTKYAEWKQGKRKAPRGPKDIAIGHRVRVARSEAGAMSQGALGARIGVSLQQVQKYEKGMNRIGAAMLHDIAVAVDKPMSYFYDDLDPINADFGPSYANLAAVEHAPTLLAYFANIATADARWQVLQFAKQWAEANPKKKSPG